MITLIILKMLTWGDVSQAISNGWCSYKANYSHLNIRKCVKNLVFQYCGKYGTCEGAVPEGARSDLYRCVNALNGLKTAKNLVFHVLPSECHEILRYEPRFY